MGERFSSMTLPGVGGSRQPLEELPHSVAIPGLPRHESLDRSFEGFPDPGSDPKGFLSC